MRPWHCIIVEPLLLRLAQSHPCIHACDPAVSGAVQPLYVSVWKGCNEGVAEVRLRFYLSRSKVLFNAPDACIHAFLEDGLSLVASREVLQTFVGACVHDKDYL